MDAFSARILGAPEASKSARFKAPDGSCMREVHVHRDQIVELESEGAWEQLGSAFERLLDGSATSSAELNAFESGGDFQASQGPIHDHAEVVRRCARVTAGDSVSMIAGGCNTLDKVAAKSMASMVCGGCIPVINEFLGQEEFVPAFCDHSETCAPDIRMFRLRLLQGEATPFVPGQHVVVQARIGGHWISRPYTISSTRERQDLTRSSSSASARVCSHLGFSNCSKAGRPCESQDRAEPIVSLPTTIQMWCSWHQASALPRHL